MTKAGAPFIDQAFASIMIDKRGLARWPRFRYGNSVFPFS
jgi:hypothetical protein